jgi:hypothetical protein
MCKHEILKIYRVSRDYGPGGQIVDYMWAYNIDDVYELMHWERGDTPPLRIIEIVQRHGGFASHMVPARDPNFFKPKKKKWWEKVWGVGGYEL